MPPLGGARSVWRLAAVAVLAGLGLAPVASWAAVSVSKDFLTQITGPIGSPETPVVTVNRGDVVTLKLDVLNSANALTGGTLTDTFPAGMTLASVPNPRASAGCGGGIAFTAVPDAGSFTFSGAQVPAASAGVNGQCSVYVDVKVPLLPSTPAGTTATLDNTIASGTVPSSGGFTATDTVTSGTITTTAPSTRSINVRALSNLTVSKSFVPSTVNMGETSTIQIVLANPNSVTTTVTQLTESLPGNVVATGTTPTVSCAGATASASGTSGSTTLTFSGLTLPASGSCTVSWVVRGLASDGATNATAPAANTVPANSVLNDRGLPHAAANATLTVRSPLNPTKAFSPATAAANQPVQMTVTLTNRSASQTLSAVSFTDNLPAGLSLNATAVTGSAGCGGFSSFTPAGGATTLAVSGLTLAPSATCTLTASVQANNDGSYTNTIPLVSYTSSDSNVGSRQSGPASATLTAFDQITVAKAALDPRTTNATAAGTIAPGNLLRYRLTLNNYTSSVQSGLNVTDPLPLNGAAQVTFVANPVPTFSNCGSPTLASAEGAASVQFTGITIPAGSGAAPASCTIDFHVLVPPAWPFGTAVVNGTNASPLDVNQGGPNLVQGSQPNTSSPTLQPFTLAKSVSSGSVFQGALSTVTLTFTNRHFVDLVNVALVDDPVFGATSAGEVVLATPANPSTTCGGTPVYSAVAGSRRFQVSGLTVPQRGACTVSFQVRGIVPGSYVNTIPTTNVTGDVTVNGVTRTLNPTSPGVAAMTVNSVLSVSKTFAPTAVAANNGVSRVTVRLDNLGAQALTNVQVIDPLPASLQLAAVPNPSTSCGGTPVFTAVAGAASATLAGATVPGSGSCLFQFDVVTNGNGGAAPSVNTIPAGNVTADNGVFNASAASGTLNKLGAAALIVGKSFSPATLTAAGQSSRLQLTLDNTGAGAVALADLGLLDNLPSGMAVAAVPAPSTTCTGGSVTANANGTTVALSGASLAAGSTCVFEANVTLVGAGTYNNTIPAAAVTSTQGITNSNSQTANLIALASLGVAKRFSPASVTPGTPSRLTIQLVNSQPLVINLLGVTDVFPAGLVAATPSAASTTCTNGVVSVASDRITLASGSLPAATLGSSASCEVSLNVVAAAAGAYTNTIPAGGATGTDGNGANTSNTAPASATLNVRAVVPLTKSFASANVRVGQANRLTIAIDNTANAVTLTSAELVDSLPANVTVALTPNATATNCGSGAVVTAPAGAGSVRLSGATLPAGGVCSVAVDVLSNTPGIYTNTLPDGALSTAEGVSNPAPASATFSTFEPPTVGKEFLPVQIASGGTASLRIVLGNLNPSALTTTASLVDTLPAGLTLASPAIDTTTADALPRCGSTTGTSGGTTITLASGLSLPAGGCVVRANVTGTVTGSFTNTIPAGALQTNGGNNQQPGVATLSISTRNSIAGKVFLDADNNGVPAAGEVPLPGQPITLERLDNTGTVQETWTTQSNSLGNYAFLDLPDAGTGSFRLTQTAGQPAGTLSGLTRVGTLGGGTATGVAVAVSQVTGIVLNGSQNAVSYDFAELLPASVSGKAFLDLNNDGTQQSGDFALPGLTITLTGSDDRGAIAPQTATTAADGSYAFTGLRPGTYAVTQQLAQPPATRNGRTVPGSGAATTGTATLPATTPSAFSGVVLAAGNTATAYNFAEIPATRSVTGRLYVDLAGDAVFNGSDTGMGGLTLTLTGTDSNGNAVSLSTVSISDGRYVLTGVPEGTYSLSYAWGGTPASTTAGAALPGTTGGTAATRLQLTGIDLTGANTVSANNDFTRRPPGTLSGSVYVDANDNGLFEPAPAGSDVPLAGVVLTLTGTDFGPDGVEGTGDDVALVAGTTAPTATTAADGSYTFTNLRAGRYNVVEQGAQPVFNGQPTFNGRTTAGTVSGTPAGTAGVATAVTTTPSAINGIVLPPGGSSPANLFGEIAAVSISGFVFIDDDRNNALDAAETGRIAGVTLRLVQGTCAAGTTVQTVVSDAAGAYTFTNVQAGAAYRICEAQPAGYLAGPSIGQNGTTPASDEIVITAVPVTGLTNQLFGEFLDAPDLRVTKAHTPAKFTVNNRGTYTLTVRNAGQRTTTGPYTVTDRLPAGLTLAATPTGTGWACTGNTGDSSFTCTSSTAIAAGATSAQTLTAAVNVAASAAAASPVFNAVLVEGGGEQSLGQPTTPERDAFLNTPATLPQCDPTVQHNACHDATPVQLAAAVSGTVWFDGGATARVLDGSDRRLPGWRVEVVDPANATVLGTATTAADGSYRIGDLPPGVALQVRFRDAASGVVWGYPINGEQGSGAAPCAQPAALSGGTASSCAVTTPATALGVVLAPGQTLVQQSLPVDPSGVVYDATTRQPVPGAVVTLAPAGVCAGYDPATSLVNVALGGYALSGNSAAMTVGADGQYQFLFAPSAPASCTFTLSVTPPATHTFVSTLIAPAAGTLVPPGGAGSTYAVQPQAGAPTAAPGAATQYHLSLVSGSAGANVVHNHIPLDPVVPTALVLTKTGDKRQAEVGDSVLYTLTLRQTAGAALSQVSLRDRLPAGFTLIRGTVRVNGTTVADPSGGLGPTLGFNLGPLAANGQITLTYRLRVGVGAAQGDGTNRAQAFGCGTPAGCLVPGAFSPIAGAVASNEGRHTVRVGGGVFTTQACLAGKVFVDCNGNHVQDPEEVGIPGVRLYFEDGNWLVSDSEGKYSRCDISPRSHVLKVDVLTLPRGSRLTTSSNRNLGDAGSLFLDIKSGELHRADFIEGSCSNTVLEQVKARRSQGEVRSVETERQRAPALKFEGKRRGWPQQGTDSANQPLVRPRSPVPASGPPAGAPARSERDIPVPELLLNAPAATQQGGTDAR